jgi:hypothetical protein
VDRKVYEIWGKSLNQHMVGEDINFSFDRILMPYGPQVVRVNMLSHKMMKTAMMMMIHLELKIS